jgi:NAD-dependent SIR2 family protein deacetylase
VPLKLKLIREDLRLKNPARAIKELFTQITGKKASRVKEAKGTPYYLTCFRCGKSKAGEDQKFLVVYQGKYRHAVEVTLCTACWEELFEEKEEVKNNGNKKARCSGGNKRRRGRQGVKQRS